MPDCLFNFLSTYYFVVIADSVCTIILFRNKLANVFSGYVFASSFGGLHKQLLLEVP
jgi:hypothetical protein